MHTDLVAFSGISGLWEELNEVDDASNLQMWGDMASAAGIARFGPVCAVQIHPSQVISLVAFP
ncbi:MAG: hypothetical protein ABJO97_10830 [Roseibium sp.]|uniref:hypothetical protein n=1 Tax=Roseibium sp. TaxID=1936156 RepID=UPI003263E198